MAKKKVITDENVIEANQKSNTGIYVSSGSIESSDYDTTSWVDLQKDYYKMRVSDPLLSTTVDILKYPILQSEYKITSANKEVEDYVNYVFDNIKKGVQNLKYHKLLCLDFGLSMHEMIVKRGDKWNGKLTNRPIYFSPIQNETIHEFHYDEYSQFIGINHEKRVPNAGSILVNIESSDLDYITFNEEYNDIRGKALYRPDRYFWECKHKTITAKTNATIKGAGFVSIGINGDPSSGDKAIIEKIGRTISSGKSSYFSYNKEKITVDILELKNQSDVIPFLDYLDRQMFFNTLSQFVTSGIGANGSRASTEGQKSGYELMASYILQLMEENFQNITNRIIEMSFLANIDEKDWPEFNFNSIRSVDLQKVAGNARALYDSAIITKQPEDEKYFRELFGMPQYIIQTDTINAPVVPVEEKQVQATKLSRNIKADLLEFEKNFSFQSANEHYDTISKEVSIALDDIMQTYIKDITNQLKYDRTADILIRPKLIIESKKKLLALYEKGFSRGSDDIKAEIKSVNKLTSFATDSPIKPKKEKVIEGKLKRMLFNVKNVIEVKMGEVSDKHIENMGGLETYLNGFTTGFKADRGMLQTDIENSYTDGRGETLLDLGDDIETFYYTSKMDNSLCDECAPFDGQIMTKEEVQNAGLNFTSPINPACLGKYHDPNTCRCQLMVYSVNRTRAQKKEPKKVIINVTKV